MLTFLPSNPNRLHRSLPTAEQDAERPAWHRSVPPRGRGRERCGLHWNESSARAGAVVGGTIQAVVTLAIAYPGLLWDAFKGTMFSAFLQGFSGFSRSNMDFRWYGQDAINAITVESFVLNYLQAGVFKFAVDPIAGCQSNLDCAWKVVKYIYESI